MSNNRPTDRVFSLVLFGRQPDASQLIVPKMITSQLKQVCVLTNCLSNTNDCQVKPKSALKAHTHTLTSVRTRQLRVLACLNILLRNYTDLQSSVAQ